MTFWTLEGHPLDGSTTSLTLCDRHALEATNAAMATSGGEGFGDMGKAALVLEALLATVGDSLDIAVSDLGTCGECEWVAQYGGVA